MLTKLNNIKDLYFYNKTPRDAFGNNKSYSCNDYVFNNGEIFICTDKFNIFFIYPEDKEAINFFKKMMWGEDNFYFKIVIGLQKLEDFITIYNKNIDNGVK